MQWKLNVQLSCLCRKDNSAFSLHSSRTSRVNWQAPRFCVRQSLFGLPLSPALISLLFTYILFWLLWQPRGSSLYTAGHDVIAFLKLQHVYHQPCEEKSAARLSSALWRKICSTFIISLVKKNLQHVYHQPCEEKSAARLSSALWRKICSTFIISLVKKNLQHVYHQPCEEKSAARLSSALWRKICSTFIISLVKKNLQHVYHQPCEEKSAARLSSALWRKICSTFIISLVKKSHQQTFSVGMKHPSLILHAKNLPRQSWWLLCPVVQESCHFRERESLNMDLQ